MGERDPIGGAEAVPQQVDLEAALAATIAVFLLGVLIDSWLLFIAGLVLSAAFMLLWLWPGRVP